VDIEAAFPAHGKAAELVQQGEGLLDDIAQLAQALDGEAAPGLAWPFTLRLKLRRVLAGLATAIIATTGVGVVAQPAQADGLDNSNALTRPRPTCSTSALQQHPALIDHWFLASLLGQVGNGCQKAYVLICQRRQINWTARDRDRSFKSERFGAVWAEPEPGGEFDVAGTEGRPTGPDRPAGSVDEPELGEEQ
jgi:hypothetical protein